MTKLKQIPEPKEKSSEGQFTPGEWSVVTGSTSLGETGDYMPFINIFGNGICIADIPPENHGYEYDDEAEANAKLISCAPEMYSMLLEFEELVSRLESRHLGGEAGATLLENRITSLIKRATS